MPATPSSRFRYHNPVIRGFYPDPSVCRVGSDYYLAVSSFEYYPGVPLFHSRDLVNWRQIGHALTRPSQLDLSGAACSQGIFAPTLRHVDGTFYLFTTNVGGRGNFFVTTADPAGEWSDPVWVDNGDFDPSLFVDDDGRAYYTRRTGKHIAQAEIDLSTGRLLAPLRHLADAFVSNDAEGPHLYKINGHYYLMCAEGGTGYGHMVTMGRAESPWGPFESCPWNPILSHRHLVPHPIRYTGHGELVQAPDGSWWLLFLGTRHHPNRGYCFHVMGREVFLAPVTWQDGWPVVNHHQPVALEGEVPWALAGPQEGDGVWRTEFDEPSLELEWVWLRNPDARLYDLKTRPGWLGLRCAAATLDDGGSPAFVGRRQEEFCFEAATCLGFSPPRDEEAGLVLYHNREFHAGLMLTGQGANRRVVLRWRTAELAGIIGEVPIPDGVVELSVRGDLEYYRFYVRGENEPEPREVGRGSIRLLATEVATGWTGVMVGLHATARGQASDQQAAFDWFEYRNFGRRDGGGGKIATPSDEALPALVATA